MTCKEYVGEMVERARSGAPISQALSQHLAHCRDCADRWEAETELTRGMRQARASMAHRRSGDAARERLMAEFSRRPRGVLLHLGWVWAAASLAVLIAAGLWILPKRASQGSAPQPVEIAQVFAEDLADGEFVPVPYAPPLAPGENVEVVRAELTPAALARMGFVIQMASAAEVTTDLMVGEDGMPRAVRVPETVGIRF